MNINDVLIANPKVRKVSTIEFIQNKMDKDFERKLSSVYESDLIKGKRKYSDFLKERQTIVYFIVVNDIIYKIGGSGDKSGIKGTIGWYMTTTGSPGSNRFIVNSLIHKEISKGNKVEIYVICKPCRKETEIGLDGEEEYITISDHKDYEQFWLDNYKRKEKKYPVWNFQEDKKNTNNIDYQESLDSWKKYRNNK